MRYALSAVRAREAEERAVAEGLVEIETLMERAGAALAAEVERRAPLGSVAVVVGPGNNGGDGWVAARVLGNMGRSVVVMAARHPSELEGLPATVARAAVEAGVAVEVIGPEPMRSGALQGSGAVVDALFGVGLSGPVRAPYPSWIEAINRSGACVVSADVPSGVDASTGHVCGVAVRADATVAFSAAKIGTVIHPGAGLAGEVLVADIGVPAALLGVPGDPELWDAGDYRALLPTPAPDVHKKRRGRVLVVAGSASYPGAAVLAALGAQRMGAGYVVVAVPRSITPVLHAKLTSAIVSGVAEDERGAFGVSAAEAVLEMAEEFDAVVFGPGVTTGRGVRRVVETLIASSVPLVVDADGLNVLAGRVGILHAREGATVITPHPGELSVLLDVPRAVIQADRLRYGREASGPHCACVLKGAATVVSGRARQVVTRSGSPALATAGTGDVLAGAVGALLAHALPPLEAGALGAYLHGRAGEHAESRYGRIGVIADDLPGSLARVTRDVERRP